jgi:hypothetical protein
MMRLMTSINIEGSGTTQQSVPPLKGKRNDYSRAGTRDPG